MHRRDFAQSPENWLEILLIIATFISCSGVADGMEIELHFSAVAHLLGWFELLLLSGRVRPYSEHLTMLSTVISKILRLMVRYATLLIAFAFSFYILFKGKAKLGETDMFANPLISLMKTFVMLTGEFEVSSLPFDTFPYTSHAIFVLFVFLVTIVMLNLLVAVSQADAIQNETVTLFHLARFRLISEIEVLVRAFPQFVKRFMGTSLEMKDGNFMLRSNRGNPILSTHLQSLLSIISKKTKPNYKRKSTGIKEESSMFTEKLSALQIRQEELQKIFYSKFEETRKIFMRIFDRLNISESETTRS